MVYDGIDVHRKRRGCITNVYLRERTIANRPVPFPNTRSGHRDADPIPFRRRQS